MYIHGVDAMFGKCYSCKKIQLNLCLGVTQVTDLKRYSNSKVTVSFDALRKSNIVF